MACARRQHISLSGLHDVAKALVAAYLTHELRRPAYSSSRIPIAAPKLSRKRSVFFRQFSRALGGVATLPAFDTLPWESQSPHPDILERRAATFFRLTDGQVSLVIAPVQAALWRFQDPTCIFRWHARSQTTRKCHSRNSSRISLRGLHAHGNGRAAGTVRDARRHRRRLLSGGAAPSPDRIAGDTVESVREFDPRTQRSIAPSSARRCFHSPNGPCRHQNARWRRGSRLGKPVVFRSAK